MRKKRPIVRTEGKLRDASLVIIASEDRYAVKQYFDLFRSTRVQFQVLETEGGKSSPSHVMDRLCEFMREYSFGQGDQFWLICDTDHWIEPNHIKNLVDVVRQCRQKGIGVAISNPCFELWLLLHFADFPQEDSMSCEDVRRRLREVLGSYSKSKVHSLLVTDATVHQAVSRSKANFASARDIPSTPQTAVHLVVEGLIDRGIITVASRLEPGTHA